MLQINKYGRRELKSVLECGSEVRDVKPTDTGLFLSPDVIPTSL